MFFSSKEIYNELSIFLSHLLSQVWNHPSGTVFPDFTNPNVIPYWLQMISELYKKIPFDGLWLVSTPVCCKIL